MKYFCQFIIILLLFPLLSQAAESTKEVRPDKITGKIIVDGKFTEPEWDSAKIAGDFVQFQPEKGNSPYFRTEVRILYSESHIYFGFICEDREPGKIISRLSQRDADISEDDSVGIGIDTFSDHRTAYYFFTNPLGTQKDGRLSDNGRTSDSTWDEKWFSAAEKTSTGWNAEIAIPLSILKFKPGKNLKWGLGLVRIIPRLMEIDTWTGPMEATSRVSQFGTIKGLTLKKSRKNLKVIPHIISRFRKDEKIQVSAGVDLRYAISQSLSADLTINPDFAIIEADREQVNLTRFELRLPEKRNFFLEGSEIYSQRIRLFYSRRIADIHGGVKVYGKKNGYEFSAMTVQGKKDEDLGLESANFSVFRLRKDIFKSSTIGFIGANKLVDGKNYGNIGLDLVHFFSEKVNVTGQLALSYGDFTDKNIAFFLRPSYDSSTFHIHLRYSHFGENFGDNANSVGFVRDDDRRELDSAIEKEWWIKKYGIDRINYDSNYNVYWSTKGLLRSWQIDQELGIDLSNKLSLEIDYSREFKRYEKDYDNYAVELQAGYNTREWQSARFNYEFGHSFGLDYKLIGAGINYKLLKNLSLEYDLERLIFDPDPEGENTWIHIVRLTNYFTKDTYLKFFYQTNTAITKNNIQVLFVYRYQPPFGTVQLAYQRGSNRFGDIGEKWDTFFVKFSYVF
ncbi:MAG: DUF5916 domain-containing protein [Acidobacteriota bacterium]